MPLARWLTLAVTALGWLGASCRQTGEQAEGPIESDLPAEVRADYEVFAHRCSKCHSLARPLTSGITDDGFWRQYVERMRRQPASGISPADEEPILRFLHYHSIAQRHTEGGSG